ncbi:hypothetical protein [Paenibacillus sanguinis]|uniref:YfjL-like protein n=1 Tax=Paenibacillus sanguinis TaxID=225906 RepID=UPI00037AF353|nr:hypothetical protein [Paenibacillus sanguinis]
MKKKLMGLILFIITVGVLSMVYVIFYGTPWGKNEFKKDVIKYLNEKYSQEMIINPDAHYSFKLGTYSISVSPRDIKDIQFSVWQTQGKEGKLGDNYFINYWAYQASNHLNSILTVASPNNTISGKVVIQHEPGLNNYINSKIIPPSYDEVKDQLKNGTYIFIDFRRELDLQNIEKEYTDIYDIFQHIKQNGFTFDIIKVDFNKQNKFRLNYTDFMDIHESQDLKHFLNK